MIIIIQNISMMPLHSPGPASPPPSAPPRAAPRREIARPASASAASVSRLNIFIPVLIFSPCHSLCVREREHHLGEPDVHREPVLPQQLRAELHPRHPHLHRQQVQLRHLQDQVRHMYYLPQCAHLVTRLDYDLFVLTAPLTAATTQGQCSTDYMTVSIT